MWKINRKIDRGAILSAIIIAAFEKDPPPDDIEISDLSIMLSELFKNGELDMSDFKFSPGGEYSEDVVRFVGNYLLANDATARSPLQFSENGRKKCVNKFLLAYNDAETMDEAIKIAGFLNINVDNLIKSYSI